MSHAFNAMQFARHAHRDQRRKYTGNPYADHLAEVAGITASALIGHPYLDQAIAVAWLHDTIEDQGVTVPQLEHQFGFNVAHSVLWLSDLDQGNRAERKAAARQRLAGAPEWLQTIKVADVISNTPSIVQHDPAFARVYLEEIRQLLDALKLADPRLKAIAMELAGQ